jgi:hypothetical protein
MIVTSVRVFRALGLPIGVCLGLVCGVLAAPPNTVAVGLHVRFYPQEQVRAYELEPRRGWSSVLVQNIALVNDSEETVTVERVELDLVAEGDALQTQRISSKNLDAAAKKGAALQQSGMLDLLKFQFRPDILLSGGIKLSATRQLPARTALLLPYHYFTFAGRPDQVRVRAFARNEAGRELNVEAAIPVVFYKSDVKYGFPLAGTAFIGVGQSLHQGHRWVVPEEFALDIARVGGEGRTYRTDGSKRTNYFAYGAEVLAAADGTVVAVQDGILESDESLRKPDEGDDAYLQRVMAMQGELLSKGPLTAAGNYVVIQHKAHEFSFYAHLVPGSIKVTKGETLKRGQPIARLGHSGNSTEPHLHFQVGDGPDPLLSAGLPVHFDNLRIPQADGAREIQSGDLVETTNIH